MTKISGRHLRSLTVCIATIVGYTASVFVRHGLLTANPEAAIWLAAVLVAGLLLLRGSYRLVCLGTCFAVCVAGDLYFQASYRPFLTFPVAIAITYATERLLGPALNFADPRRLSLFLACVVAPVCALGGLVQLWLPVAAAPVTAVSVARWFIGHFLGLAIMTPSLVILARPRRFRSFNRSAAEICAVLAGVLAVVAFLLWHSERTGWTMAVFPMAMFIAFRYGPVGVSALSLMLAGLTVLYVYDGPQAFGGPGPSYQQTEWIQVLVTLVFLTSLPTAGVVAHLQRMYRLFSKRTLMARVARTRADAAAQAKGEFLANMSHEIRTPLNGVIGLADALSRTRLDPDQKEMLTMILSSGQALRGLLSDALDLARAQSGALSLTDEPFDVRGTIGAASYLFETLAKEKGLTFEVGFALESGHQMIGDPLRIRQIVSNLISNAVKFTEQGGVRIDTTLRDLGVGRGRLTVVVRDTGRGFDDATKARLFNRFEQGDNSVTRRYGGSGLGLSIVRELSAMMGGAVTCDSTPGEGSVFTFDIELPLRAHEPPAPAPTPRRDEAPPLFQANGPRPRLLLAEDHPVNQRVIQAILGDRFDLTIVSDGQAAIEAFRAQAFDVVLMDTHMPVLDGLSAIRTIRRLEAKSHARRTPVISLTADALAEHVHAALHAGADSHLAKPITAATLFDALAAVEQDQIANVAETAATLP